ncbi:hypothetical protein H2203_006700 [Taxawa tesnikishii (nom. ined.)]|nr:hypothetical protein H2203_006700 [Dothideales sp. JES 119]
MSDAYQKALSSNPLQVGDEEVTVEERRMKPGSYPYVPRGRGGMRGGANQGPNRGSFQGGRGGYQQRGRGGAAGRGRGGAQAA